MQELVVKKYGDAAWKECLAGADFDPYVAIGTSSDVPDENVQRMVRSIAKVSKLTMDQVIEAFGDHWSTVYAPSIYAVYFEKAKSTKELLLNLDHIHTAMTKSVKNAAPPQFKYEWESDDVLLMHYSSPRGMVAFMPALVRGVGKYYKEKVNVRLTGNTVRVQFA
jgi:hypothetical protein